MGITSSTGSQSTANLTLDDIGELYLFDKKLTFEDQMNQTAKLIREKAGTL
jgi:hypothetical protein